MAVAPCWATGKLWYWTKSSATVLSESPLTFITTIILRGAIAFQSNLKFFCGHPVYQQFSALKVSTHNHFISWVNDALILIWIKMLLTIFLARWPAPWCSRASTVPGAAWSLCCTRRRSSTRRLASSGPTPAPAPEPAASGRAPSSRSVVCAFLNNYVIPDTVEAQEKDTTPSKAGQRCMFLACTLTGLSQDLDFVRLIKTTLLIGTLFAGDGAPHAGPQVNNHITRRGHRLSRHRHKFTR